MSVAQEVAQPVGHDDRQLILEPSALGPAYHLIGYDGGTEDNIAEVVVILSRWLGESSLLNVLLEEEGGLVSSSDVVVWGRVKGSKLLRTLVKWP